jgi:LmbE family N-acetylglucosaminyl deacetylase
MSQVFTTPDEPSLFASSALVVAHPDDEALWFSSVVGRVTKVVIAYETCDDLPELGPARRAARANYPLASARFLAQREPCSLAWVDWSNPTPSAFGLALNRPGAAAAEARYQTAFAELRRELARELAGVTRVFTHNPWGEYGHPDHVQLSSVVTSLRAELGFAVSFSNYVAPRSLELAGRYLPCLRREATLATDRALAGRLKAHYAAHACWTWHPDYEPPREEAFLSEAPTLPTEAEHLPLHCLMTT